jgi:hypothetical protein
MGELWRGRMATLLECQIYNVASGREGMQEQEERALRAASHAPFVQRETDPVQSRSRKMGFAICILPDLGRWPYGVLCKSAMLRYRVASGIRVTVLYSTVQAVIGR